MLSTYIALRVRGIVLNTYCCLINKRDFPEAESREGKGAQREASTAVEVLRTFTLLSEKLALTTGHCGVVV